MRRQRALMALVAVSIVQGSCAAGVDREGLSERARAVFGVLPAEAASDNNPVTDAKVKLGRMLWYEKRLSKNHDIACSSCHSLAKYGVDHEPTSSGHRGQRGDRNSPTVYNAAFQIAQFWDGRAADVEAQAKGPILNPVEMAMPNEEAVVRVLKSIPGYEPPFRAAFPEDEDPVTYGNLARAIGAFERRLVTPSRFDRFLEGDSATLSEEELRGLELFLNLGCQTCHLGPLVGGSLYRKIGLVHVYATEDPGRFNVTRNEADRQVFKVPSLRNVAETAPYFHDGGVGTLSEAVRLMAHHQLGRTLAEEEVRSLVAFVGSLTGTIDESYIALPKLPPSGPETPEPDSS